MDIQFNSIKRMPSVSSASLSNSILIIGKALNNRLNEEIVKVKNVDEVYKVFGDSELSVAAEYVLNHGITEVFLYNTFDTDNYIKIASKLIHYDFDYIVPIGIFISDTFYNPITKTNMLYADFYISALSPDTTSTVIMTDRHAELYNDLDNFLDSMEEISNNIKNKYQLNNIRSINSSSNLDKWNNLIFTSNQLRNIEYSNVVLACELAKCTPGTYPSSIEETSVYDYDSFDFSQNNICYFRNNVITDNCSIENLLNMREKQDAYKSVLIDMIIKYIRRNLDLTKYRGKFFTKYTKVQINNDLKAFFNSINGTMIKNYTIKSIDFVLTGTNVGNVLIETSITPRGSFESLQINLEV